MLKLWWKYDRALVINSLGQIPKVSIIKRQRLPGIRTKVKMGENTHGATNYKKSMHGSMRQCADLPIFSLLICTSYGQTNIAVKRGSTLLKITTGS